MENETLLHRQINASFYQRDRVTSQAFNPMKNHNISVYDGDIIGPEDAFIHFTEEKKGNSVGVMSVTVDECINETLTVQEDYQTHVGHALIDYNGYNRKRKKEIASELAKNANDRGWQHQRIQIDG